jgi:ribonuclease VapC
MIAIDTSAIMAIVLQEAERDSILQTVAGADAVVISAGTLIETRIVSFRRGKSLLADRVDRLIAGMGIVSVPVDEAQAAIAHAAFVRFGKGSGHAAQLNFGDLFSYALAKSRNIPLLFKGQDFASTDLTHALSMPTD